MIESKSVVCGFIIYDKRKFKDNNNTNSNTEVGAAYVGNLRRTYVDQPWSLQNVGPSWIPPVDL